MGRRDRKGSGDAVYCRLIRDTDVNRVIDRYVSGTVSVMPERSRRCRWIDARFLELALSL
jgi:hypothetical protein